MSEIGVQFAKPEAVELFRKAGQRVDGEVVKLDPEFVLEQAAKAAREFGGQARNPANSVHIGGDHMVFGAVYGAPIVRGLIRPGCPVIFGSFLSNIDMQSGSPSFGTPESAIGCCAPGSLPATTGCRSAPPSVLAPPSPVPRGAGRRPRSWP